MRNEDVFQHLDECKGGTCDAEQPQSGAKATGSTAGDPSVRCPVCDVPCRLSALNAHLDAGCPRPEPDSSASLDGTQCNGSPASDKTDDSGGGTSSRASDGNGADRGRKQPQSAAARLEKLAEQMTCAICCDTFDNPHSLPCQHSFCYECLVGCFKVTGTMQCPLCKQPMWMRQVTPNHVLAGIVAAFREAVAET